MSVYYYKLWDKLLKMDITSVELMKDAHVSARNMAHMRNNEYIAWDVLDRICDYLDCDYGEIVSHKKDDEKSERNDNKIMEETAYKIRQSIKEFMDENDFDVAQIAKLTDLPENVVLSFLKGAKLSLPAYFKLSNFKDAYNASFGLYANSDYISKLKKECRKTEYVISNGFCDPKK